MRLNKSFFNRDTVVVAKDLLGKYLIRKIGRKVVAAKITETEAYCGLEDKASHASKGRTPRTEIMFGPPGHAYIYLVYGMYHCLNVVTEKKGYPAAVLIRGLDLDNCDGPGKLCRELKIDKKLNNINICSDESIWIEAREEKLPLRIKKGKRIGVDYADKWKDKLWRFYLD